MTQSSPPLPATLKHATSQSRSRRFALAAGLVLAAVIGILIIVKVSGFWPFAAPSREPVIRGFFSALNQGAFSLVQKYVCDTLPPVNTSFKGFVQNLDTSQVDKDARSPAQVTADIVFQFKSFQYARRNANLALDTKRVKDTWCITRESAEQVVEQVFDPILVTSAFFNSLNDDKYSEAGRYVCDMVLPDLPIGDFLLNQKYEIKENDGKLAHVQVDAKVHGQIGPIGIPLPDWLPDWAVAALRTGVSLDRTITFTSVTKTDPLGRWCMTGDSFVEFLKAAFLPAQ